MKNYRFMYKILFSICIFFVMFWGLSPSIMIKEYNKNIEFTPENTGLPMIVNDYNAKLYLFPINFISETITFSCTVNSKLTVPSLLRVGSALMFSEK